MTTALVVVAALMVGEVGRSAVQYPRTLEGETWVAQHELECTEQLLPRPELDSEVAGTHEVIVSLRVMSECEMATQVSLLLGADGEVEALIRYPRYRPIPEELLRLHKEHPRETPQELCSRIEMRSFGRTSKEQPNLSAVLRDFRELRVAPVPENVTYVHGQRVEVWTTAGPSSYHFLLQVPVAPSEALNPLDTWSRSVLRTLGVDCASLVPR